MQGRSIIVYICIHIKAGDEWPLWLTGGNMAVKGLESSLLLFALQRTRYASCCTRICAFIHEFNCPSTLKLISRLYSLSLLPNYVYIYVQNICIWSVWSFRIFLHFSHAQSPINFRCSSHSRPWTDALYPQRFSTKQKFIQWNWEIFFFFLWQICIYIFDSWPVLCIA